MADKIDPDSIRMDGYSNGKPSGGRFNRPAAPPPLKAEADIKAKLVEIEAMMRGKGLPRSSK